MPVVFGFFRNNAVITPVIQPLGGRQRLNRDAGQRDGLTTAEKDRIKELEREVRELRQANEILKKASAYFAQAEIDRPFKR